MSLRSVQRQAASIQATAGYGELAADLASSLRPQRPKHRTSDLPTTTRLLRNSRLFSLPKPLKRPDTSQSGGLRQTNDSETATLPYPTHQAVITHAKSFGRGDWGLKRALPAKAFRTTSPVIRIKQVDSPDHITVFESAADHTFTLQKVQELNIPITVPRSRGAAPGKVSTTHKPPISAFDERADPKDRSLELEPRGPKRAVGWGTALARPSEVRRWRYDSPWVAGMQTGDFEVFVHSTVKHKRSEFREWLRGKLAEKRSQATSTGQSSFNVDAGISDAANEELGGFASRIVSEVAEKVDVSTDKSLDEAILDLRKHPRDLFKLIWDFFDLPGRFPSPGQSISDYALDNVDVDQGPPTTHPSAGLSYLRPVRHLYNHALLGPMSETPPVPARILQKKGLPFKLSPQVIGVAGVAVERSIQHEFRDQNRGTNDANYYALLAMKEKGGPKIWAHASGATIDSKGGIRMEVTQAHDDPKHLWNPQPSTTQSEKRSWRRASPVTAGKQMPEYKEVEYKKIVL